MPTNSLAATSTREAPRPAKSVKRRRRFKSRTWVPYLFISPFFVLFAIFGLFPLLFSIFVSFHSWDPATGIGAMKWIGIENYTYALFDDEWFHRSLYNTGWIALVSGLPQHLIALPLAYFLHTAFGRWRNLFMGIYFLPFITSTVAISLVFTSLFSKDFGVVNQFLHMCSELPGVGALFPVQNIDWALPRYTKWMISFVVWWRYVGFNVVLYLSAIQTIPKDLYEAATMDGANQKKQFFYITLPMLKPMIFFAVTLTIIGNLQLFEEPFILTNGSGGLAQAGKTAAMQIYTTGFSDNDFGTASAIAWIMFMLIAFLTWANHRLLGQKD